MSWVQARKRSRFCRSRSDAIRGQNDARVRIELRRLWLRIGFANFEAPLGQLRCRDSLRCSKAANVIAYCRELLAEALNVYLQSTSNRLNQIATRLTVLATIFVPLTLITGFFGQNFGWMVRHIDSFLAFLVFGVGGIVILGGGIWFALQRSGYLNSNGQ